jgi:oxaloacetate decarboxylase alpha subunit
MAGLLRPYVAFELVSRLKEALQIPVHMQCHATTGLSTATYLKAIEAGVDNVDTAVSSMSMTYGHSATESLVAILEGSGRDTGLDMLLLEEIAAYFREVRRKYARFEGALRGVDSRILVAQVPGGMLTNLEQQLREQNATARLDEVLEEIPRVREDLGYIPLVTPTSQIVGSQALINVLTGQRYQTITRETEGVLKGEYGATPVPVNEALQRQVLDGAEPVTCRPADLLDPELDSLTLKLEKLAEERNLQLADTPIDDVLTYALFPQVGLKFLENRNNPDAFEPPPEPMPEGGADGSNKRRTPVPATGPVNYDVKVNGKAYRVEVTECGAVSRATPVAADPPLSASNPDGQPVPAGLGGSVLQVLVAVGDDVSAGQPVVVVEAMKMETEISAPRDGTVTAVHVAAGDTVAVGDPLVSIG